MTFDILIKNGTVIDGVESDGFLADVGIVGKEIRAIGKLGRADAKFVISADEKFVVPGFVDIQNHSDSYLTCLEIPSQESLVTQGITTIAVGHCGTSLAPLSKPGALKSVQKWRSLAGANLNWLDFEDFLRALRAYPLGLNILSLVGHATLRRGLMDDEVRPATREEIEISANLLNRSLESGAAGMSLGLVYAHEVDSAAEELQKLSRVVALKDKLLSVHLRSEGSHIPEALEEAVNLALQTKARLKISHFKIRGEQNWPLFEEVLGIIDRAYQKGLDIFFDVYPYTTSWTVLYTYLPKWSYEGGRAAIMQNLKNPAKREKILTHLKDQNYDYDSVFVATSETNPAFLGKTLGQIANNQEISAQEALLNVILGTNTQVIVFDHNLSPEILEIFLKHPLSVVASDGAGYDFVYSANYGFVHPRCFGTMPKFLSMVRDKKLMSWPMAIKKITSRPAEKLGLKKRGTLAVGNFADIAIFDPRIIASKASYQNPYQEPDGIDYVLVNGKIAYSNKDETRKLAGEVLEV